MATASIQILSLGDDFNQPTTDVQWGRRPWKKRFGSGFHMPIADVVWPPSLQKLEFGFCFRQSVEGIV